jgi:hypothetical protein
MNAISRDTLLKSCLCTQAQLESEEFQRWAVRIREPHMHLHRKLWEWCYITQALYERELLRPGRRGLGFAVGNEPLPSLFAGYECEITATDLFAEQAKQAGWVDSNQHAANLEILNSRGFCDPTLFKQRVSFRNVDMNNIPADLIGFDFVWSSCSLEHLGSIKLGAEFIYNSLRCLKPGGFAVHTTEFNVSSDTATLDQGPTVLFRKQDINQIVDHLRGEGHDIAIDFTSGNEYADEFVDLPPYKQETHLKLQIAQYVVTSIGLIIQKRVEKSSRYRFFNIFPWGKGAR